jgi:hypothetical protein
VKGFTVVHGLAVLTALLGVLMIVGAFSGGGGLGSFGVLVGAFFVAAGVMRLRLIRVRAQAELELRRADEGERGASR